MRRMMLPIQKSLCMFSYPLENLAATFPPLFPHLRTNNNDTGQHERVLTWFRVPLYALMCIKSFYRHSNPVS